MLRILVRSVFVLVLSQFGYPALAHDTWISRGAGKNPAGEWCCGAEDCGVVSPNAVKAGNGEVPESLAIPSAASHPST